MVARVRPERPLAVIFTADGEDPETKIIANSHRAAVTAIMLIANRGELHDGDQTASAELR